MRPFSMNTAKTMAVIYAAPMDMAELGFCQSLMVRMALDKCKEGFSRLDGPRAGLEFRSVPQRGDDVGQVGNTS
ncbi:hypothetical protein NXC24_PA00152 (plasmid) [Rhizobium sp. NXC24]|nr:hypothetical protein NXC24_PA00152 [Rhizobium sp. NXC24]